MKPRLAKPDSDIVQEYWKWHCSLPKDENPAINNDGDKDVTANQRRDDEYFFLSFVLGGSKQRICTVPKEKKKILIPSLCFLASGAELRNPPLPNELKEYAKTDHDNIEYRSIEIDGNPIVGNIDQYRVEADNFRVTYADRNPIFNVDPKKECDAVADGVYIVWEPEPGQHIIHFKGKVDLPDDNKSLEFRVYEEDVTYTLTVPRSEK